MPDRAPELPPYVRFVRAPGSGEHEATGPYVERFWLPILGPSAVAILRAGPWIELRTMTWYDAGRTFGIQASRSPNSHLWKIVIRMRDRLVADHFAADPETVEVRIARRLPTLSEKQVRRLPPQLRVDHDIRLPGLTRDWRPETVR